jgi:hypothetical protein
MVTSELVEKLGLAFFTTMSMLILVCIMIGFYAVFDAYNKPNECVGAIMALTKHTHNTGDLNVKSISNSL